MARPAGTFQHHAQPLQHLEEASPISSASSNGVGSSGAGLREAILLGCLACRAGQGLSRQRRGAFGRTAWRRGLTSTTACPKLTLQCRSCAVAGAALSGEGVTTLPLQLHFDVNKTILLEDSAGGKTAKDICNSTLADATWGRVCQDGKSWAPSGLPLSIDAPQADVVTYTAWTRMLHSDVVVPDGASAVEVEKARQASRQAKAARDALQNTFAEPGGAAPPEVAALLPKLLDALSLPKAIRSRAGAQAAGLSQRTTWFLLPTWLMAIRRLVESGDSFCLIFRTFGDDASEVAAEFNVFATGAHPLHPGFSCDGASNKSQDLKRVDRRLYLETDGCGSFFRDKDGPILALGTLRLPEAHNREDALAMARRTGCDFACGIPAIHQLLQQRSASEKTLVLRDHWRFWRDCGEAGSAGKLLLVDDNSHAVFIDDNIRGPDGHIVDVRDAATAASVPWETVQAKGLVETAWPYAALLEQDYFLRIVDRAKQKWQRLAASAAERKSRL